MAISETKMQIVIANYFKDECDVNTSIKQAFEKGFRIGVKKGANTNRPQGEWISKHNGYWTCSECGLSFLFYAKGNFCPNCGADMRKGVDNEN